MSRTTHSAADSTTHSAADSTTHSATASTTDSATDGATESATDGAPRGASRKAPRSKAHGATRSSVRPLTRPDSSRRWALGPIDRFALRWLIQGTWVFDSRLDAEALRQGIARLLDAYPILSGRVAGDEIVPSDAGITFVETADESVAVADFGPATVDVQRFGERPSLGRIRRGKAPLLTVRLTAIRDGCVLAICCSHACVDGYGFYSLARNLGAATAGRAFTRPSFDRPRQAARTRSRREVAREARERGWPGFTLMDLLRFAVAEPRQHDRAFVEHFTPAALARCKAELGLASGRDRLSTNSALVAHIAHCLSALIGLDPDERFAVSLVVDQRGRVPGIAEDFAGNAAAVVATAPIPASAPTAQIAAAIDERIQPIAASPSPALASIVEFGLEVAEHRLPNSPIRAAHMLGRRPRLFYTNSFSKFPVYDVDFGDAAGPVRPVRAIPHNLADPVLLWPAPPESGGVELYFSSNLARAVGRLDANDPWWQELGRYGHVA